jgi:YggT family protein
VSSFLANFVAILGYVLVIAIIVRALMSWFMPADSGPFGRMLAEITEPVLGPIRRVLPPMGGLDLSPLVAIILVQLISSLLETAIQSTS